MPIDTDPQQQEAALPQALLVRSFLRYAACDVCERTAIWAILVN